MKAQRSFIHLCVISVFMMCSPLNAQEHGSRNTGDDGYRAHITILPDVSYSPETRLVLGGVLVYQFKPAHSGDNTRSSNLILNTAYTLNRQLIVEAFPHVLLPGEKWILDGSYYYHFYPQNYWGIGSDTRTEDKWDIEYKQWWFRQTVLKKVGDHLFAGPQIRWSRTYQMKFMTDGIEQRSRPVVNGALPTSTNGFGFVIRWDTR
ncbi:MAG TPA: hypothetical protein VKA08_17240, partial [Balneolales bacterium]|nr:hypothetical protein [Balneolales bacterium]